jgi:hypothetical protein
MSFEPFLDLWDCMTIAEFLISVGLGWAGLLLTLCLKERHILTGIWYLSLRHSLILLSISSLSNAWSILLIDQIKVYPTQLFMNMSMFVLLVWICSFYRFILIKNAGSSNLEKILKFLHTEVVKERATTVKPERLR